MLYAILHWRGQYRLSMLVAGRIFRILLAAGLMGAALWFMLPWFGNAFTGREIERLIAVLTLVGSGAIVFFGAAWALGVVNAETIGQLRRRRA